MSSVRYSYRNFYTSYLYLTKHTKDELEKGGSLLSTLIIPTNLDNYFLVIRDHNGNRLRVVITFSSV